MQKILFTEFAELKQGDGKGPKYFAGKAYWLTPDQAVRWKAEGVADDAPADMPAENEQDSGHVLLRPETVRIVRTKGSRYNVMGPDDHKFNDEPLSAAAAETLRKDVLDGKVTILQPAVSVVELPLDVDGPVSIELLQINDKEDRKTIYVAKPWPKLTRFDDQIFDDGIKSGLLSVSDDKPDILHVLVANGMAEYRIERDSNGWRVGTLIDSTFEVPPTE